MLMCFQRKVGPLMLGNHSNRATGREINQPLHVDVLTTVASRKSREVGLLYLSCCKICVIKHLYGLLRRTSPAALVRRELSCPRPCGREQHHMLTDREYHKGLLFSKGIKIRSLLPLLLLYFLSSPKWGQCCRMAESILFSCRLALSYPCAKLVDPSTVKFPGLRAIRRMVCRASCLISKSDSRLVLGTLGFSSKDPVCFFRCVGGSAKRVQRIFASTNTSRLATSK